mgnify:CR=1 FL=1
MLIIFNYPGTPPLPDNFVPSSTAVDPIRAEHEKTVELHQSYEESPYYPVMHQSYEESPYYPELGADSEHGVDPEKVAPTKCDADTILTGFSEEGSDKDNDSDGELQDRWLMVKRVPPNRSNKQTDMVPMKDPNLFEAEPTEQIGVDRKVAEPTELGAASECGVDLECVAPTKSGADSECEVDPECVAPSKSGADPQCAAMLGTTVNVTHAADTHLTDSDGEPLANWLMVKRVPPKRSNKAHKRQKK